MEQGTLFSEQTGLAGTKWLPTPDATPPNVRRTDPTTSRRAGTSAKRRAPSQRDLLLREFANGKELTDEQAGIASGLASKPNCCYWKRLSELRSLGLIETTGRTALSRASEQQRVCRITPAGIRHLEALDSGAQPQ